MKPRSTKPLRIDRETLRHIAGGQTSTNKVRNPASADTQPLSVSCYWCPTDRVSDLCPR